jgi:hypothetical protein
MDPHLRSQRLWQLLDRFSHKLLYRIGRAARLSVNHGTHKHDLIEALCALPEPALERALVDGLARQDLQTLCKRLGYASIGSNADLAARLLAAVDDPALHAPRWRPFAEARAFAQRLGLATRAEWYAFGRGHLPDKGVLPADIPVAPDARYANAGWTSWGDFLGTGYVAPRMRTHRTFQQAQAYARSLGLTSQAEWYAFARGDRPDKGTLPADIPVRPAQTYANTGWTSWGDFLGTGYVAQRLRTYRPFRQARAYARSLGLTSKSEWLAFVRGDRPDKGTLPTDIPRHPNLRYAKSGWTSWGDFLGTGKVSKEMKAFRPFRQARAYARSLGLTGRAEWYAFALGDRPDKGTLPADIPVRPDQTYAKAGWTSWGDFLGTGNVARHIMTYRPFQEARAYARSLGLGSRAEWNAFCRARSGKQRALRPDIPAAPHAVYANHGWLGYGDWLGTGRVRPSKDQYRSYEEACTFVHALGIRTQGEWRAYCRGELGGLGPRPRDIPSAPSQVYRGHGWVSWGHFLGTNVVANVNRIFRSFAAARAFVRKQGLRSNAEWRAWCGTGNRPADIPASPDAVYRGRGWVSWRDFLGTDDDGAQSRPPP